MPSHSYLYIYSVLLLLLSSCANYNTPQSGSNETVEYASLLNIEEADSFTKVVIKDAWKPQRTAATYLLIPSDRPLPVNLPQGIIVRTPLRRMVLMSSVHASLFLELQAETAIAGLADTAYLVSQPVRQLLQRHVRSVGSSMQPDLETLRALHTDAIFVSPFENAGYGSLERLGIPLIICADYMETSPLGRAEWMKFYGRLARRGTQADSLFNCIEQEYIALRTQAEKATGNRPTVFCDLRTSATWYQPGGSSTMGQFIKDAGGNYLWAERKESGSIPLDLESVFGRAAKADIWLIKYGDQRTLNYASLAREFPPARRFRPWQQQRIWVCNTLASPFYEEVPFHPEKLLRNLIHIFHPKTADIPTDTNFYHPLPVSNSQPD